MDAISTVTLTIGRNRRPGSLVAPNAALSDAEWAEFQAAAIDALKAHAGGIQTWVEVHTGFGEWDGVREESAKVAILGVADVPIAALSESVRTLSARFDQDAIAVQTGMSMLVEPAFHLAHA